MLWLRPHARSAIEITRPSLEWIIHNIGQQAGNSAIQLAKTFGAEIPSDY